MKLKGNNGGRREDLNKKLRECKFSMLSFEKQMGMIVNRALLSEFGLGC